MSKDAPARGTYGPLSRRKAEAEAESAPDDLEARIEALKAQRPPRRSATTPRYGRKGQPGMVQLGVVVPEALKAQLVAFAEAHGLHLAEAAEVVLERGLSVDG